jgi:hypothetical protein
MPVAKGLDVEKKIQPKPRRVAGRSSAGTVSDTIKTCAIYCPISGFCIMFIFKCNLSEESSWKYPVFCSTYLRDWWQPLPLAT